MNVLIVGAGPTGLMLAVELARRGVAFRIIDRNSRRSHLSKAMVVHIRTLEIYDALGIAEQALAAGETFRSVHFHPDGGREPIEVRFDGVDGPYSSPLVLEQSENERILEEKLESLGSVVERDTELLDAEGEGAGFRARLRSPRGITEHRCDLLVGCDGASSTVRRIAGLPFEGATYEEEFILGDVELHWQYPPGEVRGFLSDEGLLLAFPMRGDHRYRLIGVRRGYRAEGEPTLGEFREIASRLAPVEMRIGDPRWFSSYRVHCRGAPTYRRGGILLAGDAAHVHSPAGGQGMNTGLQDAWNLGWKIALWASGAASPEVLDSYDAERRPFGEFLLSRTDAAFRTMLDAGPMLRLIRRRLVPLLTRQSWVQKRVNAFVSQVGIRYAGGPLIASRSTFRPATLTPGRPQVGERAPEAGYSDTDGGSGSVFADLRDGRYLLYLAPRVGEHASAERQALEWRFAAKALIHEVAAQPAAQGGAQRSLRVHYRLPPAAHLLVRPDGYIASMGPLSELRTATRILQL